jgi:hypothetical protein
MDFVAGQPKIIGIKKNILWQWSYEKTPKINVLSDFRSGCPKNELFKLTDFEVAQDGEMTYILGNCFSQKGLLFIYQRSKGKWQSLSGVLLVEVVGSETLVAMSNDAGKVKLEYLHLPDNSQIIPGEILNPDSLMMAITTKKKSIVVAAGQNVTVWSNGLFKPYESYSIGAEVKRGCQLKMSPDSDDFGYCNTFFKKKAAGYQLISLPSHLEQVVPASSGLFFTADSRKKTIGISHILQLEKQIIPMIDTQKEPIYIKTINRGLYYVTDRKIGFLPTAQNKIKKRLETYWRPPP